MLEEKLNRINELAKLSKTRALSDEEKEEQALLRAEYIAEWKRGAQQVLDNTYVVTPDGVKHKLKKKK